MIDILKFVLRDFWTFIGFIMILNCTLYFTVNGAVQIIKHITKRQTTWQKQTDKQTEIDDRIRKIIRCHAKKDPVSMDVLLTNKCDKITAAQIAEMRRTTEAEIRRIIRKDKRELNQGFEMAGILPKG